MRGVESFSVVLALVALPALAHAQVSYTLVDVAAGSPYDGVSLNGINAAGHMSGYGVVSATGEIHAFILHDGVFDDLGLLGYQASDGIAINASDQLAVDGIGPGSTALFWSDGKVKRVGSVDGGYSSAYGINSRGDMAGSAKNGDGNTVGFSWIAGTFTDLSTVGITRAAAINDSDQIAGSTAYYYGYGGYLHGVAHACLLSGGVVTELGSLAGYPRTNAEAFGINASGQVVGYSTASDGLEHAFLYTGGAMQDLGTLAGANAAAIAINAGGEVIGNLTNAYGANLGAFVVVGGTMTDLSTLLVNSDPGWSQLVVTGLNDGGSIVGYGTLNGGTHGFLAMPVSATAVGPAAAVLRTAIPASAPNPFRSGTTITLELAARDAAGRVRLEVFDTAGRRVATLLDGQLPAGRHSIAWSGRDDAGRRSGSGIYFARLSSNGHTASRRLALAP